MNRQRQTQGIIAALASAFFLGLAPVFGRQAILLGLSPLAVVAIRTSLAALLLLGVIAVFYRQFLYIYPAGLLGCLLAGWINGLGSLFYYSALGRINAGVAQLLYALYPLFLALWLSLDRQPPSRLTVFRLLMALPAIALLVQGSSTSAGAGNQTDLIGVVEMLIAAALYALHLPFNQRVLYDMPPQTVTLYTLIAMSAVVVPPFLFSGALGQVSAASAVSVAPASHALSSGATVSAASTFAGQLDMYWRPLLGLTLVTFISRLTLFMSVKHLGGMQAALLSLGEVLVTVVFAYLWLGEHFTPIQWAGAILLTASLMLAALEKPVPRRPGAGGFLSWLHPAGLPPETWPPE